MFIKLFFYINPLWYVVLQYFMYVYFLYNIMKAYRNSVSESKEQQYGATSS